MDRSSVPQNVIRRLPRYIRFLDQMDAAGITRVSSSEFARQMGLTASQIRQDLNYFGGFGQPGYGYVVQDLRKNLAAVLGMDRGRPAILIGAGNLGHALMKNFPFSDYGFVLGAAFDVDTSLVGTRVNNIPICSLDSLEEYISVVRPDVAILTLPGRYAGAVARKVVQAGVRGIWNFTNSELTAVPDGTIIENIHFSDSLLALSFYLSADDDAHGEQNE